VLRGYEDIVKKLGPPVWWDEHGAPHYAPFSPEMLGVYTQECALVEIGCQACPERFLVAFAWNPWGGCARCMSLHDNLTPESVKGLHYGDPPRHESPSDKGDCVGVTMNCEDFRVLEFWRRHEGKTTKHADGLETIDDPAEWMKWHRVTELEIALQDAEQEG
jgi:hypothetical protein